MEEYSSEDCQYIEDLDYTDNDFCVTDIEEQKIDKLTKDMNVIKELLYKFDDTKLNDIDNIKKDFYFLCDNNRYLIDDSRFLQKLETNIYENISIYEDKLFKIYEELVDKEEELINKKASKKDKVSYDKILKECGLDGNPLHKINFSEEPFDIEKEELKEYNRNMKFSYNELKDCNLDELKELRKQKDKYESKQFKELKEIKELCKQKKINESKYELKNIDDLNDIDSLKDEYYKRIDIIMESKGTLNEKLSDANHINIFEIKEKLTRLQNKS